MSRGRLLHVTTTDMSLVLLLGPQLRAFAEAGFEVHTASAPGPYVARLEAWGIPHHPLRHATRSVAPGRDAAAAVELEGLFRRIRPDIVHTHNPKPGLYGRLGARAARVPAVVNTVHGLYATPDDPLVRRGVVYALERLAATCSDAELVQNEEDLRLLERLGVPRERLHLLGNGVDLERFRPGRLEARQRAELRRGFGAGPDDVVVGAVGRLVAEKGYPELFAAAAELALVTPTPAQAAVPATRLAPPATRLEAPGPAVAPEEPGRAPSRIRLVVVGPEDPDKADALSPDALAAAREAGVSFLGNRNDVEDLYGAFDCYVLASHREGFPRSAMEASASGLPVVATNIRGCRQVVEHGKTGLLVPVRDDHALAGALAVLAGDPARRTAMGAAGRAKAEREFDQRRVIAKTLAVYDELLAREPGSPGTADHSPATSPAGVRPAGSAGLPPVSRTGLRPAGPTGGRPAGRTDRRPAGATDLRPAGRDDLEAIARLHRSALPDAFLSSLGEHFLALLYRRMLSDETCFVVVANASGAGGVAGFVAGTEDTRRLYRDFLLRDGPKALWTAGPTLATRAPRVLESLRYGVYGGGANGWPHSRARGPGRADLASPLPKAELLALAVAPRARRHGVGRDLVAAFQYELGARRRGIAAASGVGSAGTAHRARSAGGAAPSPGAPLARVVVAEANEAARALYAKAGFRLWDVTELHRGRRSAILVWP